MDLAPSYELPIFTISYNLPNSLPEVVEAEATSVIENAAAQLSEIKKITSVSSYNRGSVEVTFNRNINIAFKRFEIASLVQNLYPKLTKSLTYPVIENGGEKTEAKKPIIVYSVTADLAPYQIKKILVENFAKSIAQIRGVNEIRITGANDLQLTLVYNLRHLEAKKKQPKQLIEAIRNHNITDYFQHQTASSNQLFPVKLEATIPNLATIENIPLSDSVNSLRLKELANVYWEEQKNTSYFRVNGQNSVTISIYADDNINRISLAETITKEVINLSHRLPENFNVYLELDDTAFLKKEIRKNYWRAGLAFVILLLFIAIVYRNLIQILSLISSTIITLCLTGLFAWLFSIRIHLYTIAGLSISFGMIVDNSIVMLDQLHNRRGKNIIKAILGATLTTIVTLLLVFFLPDEERLNLTDFCTIVSIAMGCSVLVAVFYVPAAFKLWSNQDTLTTNQFKKLRRKVIHFKAYQTFILFLVRFRKTVILITVLGFGLPVFLLPARWENHKWYNATIGSEFYQEQLRPYLDKALGGSLRLFVRHVYGNSGYREPEKTKLYINAQLPVGHNLDDMNSILLSMEAYLKTIEGIDKYITDVHSGEYGSITIQFKEQYEDGSLPYQLKSQLIANSLNRGGVEWNIFGVGQGFSNTRGENIPSFRVEMKGYNYDELERQANKLANKLLTHKRIQKVDINERLNWDEKRADRLTLWLNSQMLATKNLAVADVTGFLNSVSENQRPSLSISFNNKEVPLFLQEAHSEDFSKYDAASRSYQLFKKQLSMADFVRITSAKNSNSIYKDDRQYIRIVGFEYYGSVHFGETYLNNVLEEMKNEMPTGYVAKQLTWKWDWNKVKRQYSLLLLLMLVIYMIGAILFESMTQPLVILVIIPTSFVGLFFTFGLFEFYFDQGGYAALILLGGVSVNATIFIINDFNSLKGKNKNRNIVKAAFVRATTILLTILSTCVGLIPFLIGGQNEVFWFTLAVGTMGGLLASIYGVFVLCPILFFRKKIEKSIV